MSPLSSPLSPLRSLGSLTWTVGAVTSLVNIPHVLLKSERASVHENRFIAGAALSAQGTRKRREARLCAYFSPGISG